MSQYQYKVQGINYDVEIEEIKGNIAHVTVNGIPFEVEVSQPLKPTSSERSKVKVSKPVAPVPMSPSPKATPQPQVQAGAGMKILSPLPGTITEIKFKEGDLVRRGETVIVLEAMKMQNNIEAEVDGTITSILVNKGDTVMEGTVLLTIG